MKSSFTILLLCLALTGCWKEPSKYNWKNAPGAEQYERLMWQAIREQQWNEVEHHLASTFVGVSSNGEKFDRGGWVEYWKAHQPSDISMGELGAETNGADMVMSYEAHLSGAGFNGAGLQIVSVWQQVNHGWLLIAQSMTSLSK